MESTTSQNINSGPLTQGTQGHERHRTHRSRKRSVQRRRTKAIVVRIGVALFLMLVALALAYVWFGMSSGVSSASGLTEPQSTRAMFAS